MPQVGNVLVSIFMLAGMVWVFFMLSAMLGILNLAPKGQKMRTYNQLGMWNFGQIRNDLGPGVEPYLRTMRRGGYAFLIFFVVAAAIAVISFFVTSANPGTP